MKEKGYTIELTNKLVNFNKSILLVLTFGLISMVSFATTNTRYQASELTISMWERSAEFIVVIDGYQEQGRGIITLDHIKPGKHYIKVIQLHRSRCSNERGKTLLHKGMINVPRHSKMTAVVKPRMGLRIVNVQPIVMINNHNHYNHNDDTVCDQPSYENCYECDGGEMGCNECWPTVSQCGTIEPSYPNFETDCNLNAPVQLGEHDLYTQYMIGHDMYNDNSSTMPSGYYGSFMSEYEMDHLLKELEDVWFDSDRIKLAKRRIKAKKVTSAQVLEIIEQFSFESSRLEVAKYAFNYTIDQDNYYEVNKGFEFLSSINELEESIFH